MNKLRNIIWGILLVFLGILIAVDATGLYDIDFFFDGFWTLFIIVPCAVGLVTERDKKGNLIGLIVGVFLLLAVRDVIDIEMLWKLLIPAILIVIGASLIFKDLFDKKFNAKVKALNASASEKMSYGAFFSSQDMNFNGSRFDGAEINAVFGGFKLDLRGAVIDHDIVVEAGAIFGGIDIIVPRNLNVKVQSSSLFGGVSGNKSQSVNEMMPTIYIKASCMFGGVTIK
jgi:predicted membrane protein